MAQAGCIYSPTLALVSQGPRQTQAQVIRKAAHQV